MDHLPLKEMRQPTEPQVEPNFNSPPVEDETHLNLELGPIDTERSWDDLEESMTPSSIQILEGRHSLDLKKYHRPEPEGAIDSASEDTSRADGRASRTVFRRGELKLDLNLLGEREEPPGRGQSEVSSPREGNPMDSVLDMGDPAGEQKHGHSLRSLPLAECRPSRPARVKRRPFWRRKKKSKSQLFSSPGANSTDKIDNCSDMPISREGATERMPGSSRLSSNNSEYSSDDNNDLNSSTVRHRAQVHHSMYGQVKDSSDDSPETTTRSSHKQTSSSVGPKTLVVSLPPIENMCLVSSPRLSPRVSPRPNPTCRFKGRNRKPYQSSNNDLSDLLSKVNFTAEQLQEFKEAFQIFDKDQDGFISSREVRTLLVSVGQDPSSDQVATIMEQLDVDGSGTIEFGEFLLLMHRLFGNMDTEEDMVEVFRVLDQDGDGYISKADLRDVAARLESGLTHHDLDEMFAEADKDGDGQVNFEEFVRLILSRY